MFDSNRAKLKELREERQGVNKSNFLKYLKENNEFMYLKVKGVLQKFE